MAVTWSQQHGCYIYSCAWGCFDYDFESRHEAEQAFAAHSCYSQGPAGAA